MFGTTGLVFQPGCQSRIDSPEMGERFPASIGEMRKDNIRFSDNRGSGEFPPRTRLLVFAESGSEHKEMLPDACPSLRRGRHPAIPKKHDIIILYPSSCCLYNCPPKISSHLTCIDRFFKLYAGAMNRDLDVALAGTGYPGDLPVRQTAADHQRQDVLLGF